jgi:hypothetical protein
MDKVRVHEMPFETRLRCFMNDLEYLCKFYSVQIKGDNCYQCDGPLVEDFLTGDTAKKLNWTNADAVIELKGKQIHPAPPGALTLIDDAVYRAADLKGEVESYLRIIREAELTGIPRHVQPVAKQATGKGGKGGSCDGERGT